MVGGVPARMIRKRFPDEIVQELLKISVRLNGAMFRN